MLQAVLEKAGRFRLAEAPKPAPKSGEALLRVLTAGICGSDLHLFREGRIGDVPIERAGGRFIPGHECSALVEDVGPGAPRGLVGKRVAVEPADSCGRCELCLRGDQNLCPQVRFLGHPPVPGCLQEFLTHRAELLVELPDEISDEAGMVLEPLGVALHALRIGGVRPGGSAAVLGSGPIGLSCIMLLSRMGVSPVIATDLLDYRLAMAREFGARHTLNPARDDVPAAVHKLTNGRGVDYVLECAGAPEALMQSAEVAAVGGRVLVLGIPVKDEFAIRHTSARRKGLTMFMIRRSNLAARDCLQWALQSPLPLARMVTHRWPLEKVQEAFETVAACADGVVKGAIRVSGG